MYKCHNAGQILSNVVEGVSVRLDEDNAPQEVISHLIRYQGEAIFSMNYLRSGKVSFILMSEIFPEWIKEIPTLKVYFSGEGGGSRTISNGILASLVNYVLNLNVKSNIKFRTAGYIKGWFKHHREVLSNVPLGNIIFNVMEITKKLTKHWPYIPDDLKESLSGVVIEIDGEIHAINQMVPRVLYSYVVDVERSLKEGELIAPPQYCVGELASVSLGGNIYNFKKSFITSTSTDEVDGHIINSSVVAFFKAIGLINTCPSCGTVTSGPVFSSGCKSCLEIDEEHLQVKGYHTDATDYFNFKIHAKNPQQDRNKVRFFGIELEYESNDTNKDVFYVAACLRKHAIMKHDGSLQDGIEIVSAPADIQTHKQEYQEFFNHLNSSSLFTKETTGMHVHVDKGRLIRDIYDDDVKTYSKMSFLTLGKISKFISDSRNTSFLSKIGGRNPSRYAKLGTGLSLKSPLHMQRRDDSDFDRYQALNLENEHTIEFRFFITPKTYPEFCKNLEFCDAVIDFCSPGNSSMKELTQSHFEKFVKNRAKAYPNLSAFLFKKEKVACV